PRFVRTLAFSLSDCGGWRFAVFARSRESPPVHFFCATSSRNAARLTFPGALPGHGDTATKRFGRSCGARPRIAREISGSRPAGTPRHARPAPPRSGTADHRDVGNPPARAQGRLDFARLLFFPAGDDPRVAPAEHVEAPAVIDPPEILRRELALAAPRREI